MESEMQPVYQVFRTVQMAARYRHRLAEAIASVNYTGLDLSSVAYERR